jgi:hypothetical protein
MNSSPLVSNAKLVATWNASIFFPVSEIIHATLNGSRAVVCEQSISHLARRIVRDQRTSTSQ